MESPLESPIEGVESEDMDELSKSIAAHEWASAAVRALLLKLARLIAAGTKP